MSSSTLPTPSSSGGVQAFRVSTVVAPFKAVECVEAYNDTILAGLGDGTLISFVQTRSTTAHDADPQPWEVAQVIKGFGKAYLRQMQVIAGRGQPNTRLLSLCEEGVNVHRLPEFTLQCQADRTRLATRFAWDASTSMLAVAVKRRIAMFHLDGSDLVALREFALTDIPVQVAWYCLLNVNGGVVTELFSAGRVIPCMLPLPNEQGLLLTRDAVAVFLGPDGKPSRRAALPWSQPPASMATSPPYCVACLDQYIEVRSLHPLALGATAAAQLLPLAGMTHAAPSVRPDGGIVVASGGSEGVHCLQPISYQAQAQALADTGDFAQALSLCALMADKAAARALEDELHVRYGMQLSAAGELDQAMAQLSMATVASPVTLLRLVPWALPTRLLQGLPCPYQHLTSSSPPQAPPSPRARSHALATLLPYLLSHRSRLLAGNGAPSTCDPVQLSAQGASEAAPSYLQDLGSETRGRLRTVVDTAILKAMLAVPDTGALLRFCASPSVATDLQEAKAALEAAGRYSELVALLQQRGRHAEALQLLQLLSCHPARLSVPPSGAAADLQGLPGVWAAVKYVAACPPGGLDSQVVDAHAPWILAADPEAGLEMFLQTKPPMPPEAVLPVLSAAAPQLRATYLEAALQAGTADPARYDTQLALLYVQQLLAADAGAAEGKGFEQQRSAAETRARLHELLLQSRHIDTQGLLSKLPLDALLDVRALLLERQASHSEVLRIYVSKLRDVGMAESYCERMVARGCCKGEIYLQLIEVMLDTARAARSSAIPPSDPVWQQVVSVLLRAQRHVPVTEALALLPAGLALQAVAPFLCGALKGCQEQRRRLAVVKNLRRGDHLGVHEALVRARQRRHVVDQERACGVCHKQLGAGVLVALPSGVLQHYVCHARGASGA